MNRDLLIIGNEPAAGAGALAAAALRPRVALVVPPEQAESEGRPRNLRQVVARLLDEAPPRRPSLADVHRELAELARAELAAGERRLRAAGVEMLRGRARFLDEATVLVESADEVWSLSAELILIATGTRPDRPSYVPFGSPRIITADELRSWETLPARIAIVGGGATGREHSRLFAALGSEVFVADARSAIDAEDEGADDDLPHPACLPNVTWRSGVEAIGAARLAGGGVSIALDDGGRIVADAVLWCTERVGNTERLYLAAAGIVPDDRGRLWCDDDWRTWAPGIYAAGEVVGHPRWDEADSGAASRIVEHALNVAVPCGAGGGFRRAARPDGGARRVDRRLLSERH
ncbi:MAG: FAD-dependent oxidoreductase [Planctomycetaceae bacterium]